jgi:hypothetical protein
MASLIWAVVVHYSGLCSFIFLVVNVIGIYT